MFASIEALQLDCIVTSSGRVKLCRCCNDTTRWHGYKSGIVTSSRRVTGIVNSATLITRPSSFIVTRVAEFTVTLPLLYSCSGASVLA